jgi:hypothetical protein
MESGGEFHLDWAGRSWTLKLDEPCPGLHCASDRSEQKLLALAGLARSGRLDENAFHAGTLAGIERWRERVQATFAPPGWGGLRVRAAWGPLPRGEAIDLEIQAAASSVGELREFEVAVLSRLAGPGASQAGMPRALYPPLVVAPPGGEAGEYYVEMARPGDVTRRFFDERVESGSAPAFVLRAHYALFGHDLEKGVVLRARLRGLWLRSAAPEVDALARYREFLTEPPPLGP